MNIKYDKIRKDAINNAKNKLNIFADKVVLGVKSRTPEDTRNLVTGIGKSEQIFTGTKLLQKVYDKKGLKYTKFVEYGVGGKPFNYHKPKGSVFFVAVGAGMFRRTYFDLKNKFNG